MLAVEPDESYVGSSALRQTEQVFAGAISLAVAALLWSDEAKDYTQWEGRETLATLTWFKQPVDEMMAAQPFTFGECIGVKAHWLISLLTLEGNGAGHPS